MDVNLQSQEQSSLAPPSGKPKRSIYFLILRLLSAALYLGFFLYAVWGNAMLALVAAGPQAALEYLHPLAQYYIFDTNIARNSPVLAIVISSVGTFTFLIWLYSIRGWRERTLRVKIAYSLLLITLVYTLFLTIPAGVKAVSALITFERQKNSPVEEVEVQLEKIRKTTEFDAYFPPAAFNDSVLGRMTYVVTPEDTRVISSSLERFDFSFLPVDADLTFGVLFSSGEKIVVSETDVTGLPYVTLGMNLIYPVDWEIGEISARRWNREIYYIRDGVRIQVLWTPGVPELSLTNFVLALKRYPAGTIPKTEPFEILLPDLSLLSEPASYTKYYFDQIRPQVSEGPRIPAGGFTVLYRGADEPDTVSDTEISVSQVLIEGAQLSEDLVEDFCWEDHCARSAGSEPIGDTMVLFYRGYYYLGSAPTLTAAFKKGGLLIKLGPTTASKEQITELIEAFE
ncbi:hypothetical protein A2703_03085 [Candidatus Collierbacteria bacterium RIFCSPHIGHO2_01_FULL_50_25]|uniref:Uncharacterized protein n=1 Tax=Candidatus Collierbacteria bacterium RIFCSPHIGHO2_01_FULL_50_25 TaxID=1817722 RepID=A0A1F5EWH3_9BACT|nr:MAG: hypothetical protein A2703_03085 [Candidatus Collierbacteria bacterium RIFCSPHIGHO2_01_FULL_50_25]